MFINGNFDDSVENYENTRLSMSLAYGKMCSEAQDIEYEYRQMKELFSRLKFNYIEQRSKIRFLLMLYEEGLVSPSQENSGIGQNPESCVEKEITNNLKKKIRQKEEEIEKFIGEYVKASDETNYNTNDNLLEIKRLEGKIAEYEEACKDGPTYTINEAEKLLDEKRSEYEQEQIYYESQYKHYEEAMEKYKQEDQVISDLKERIKKAESLLAEATCNDKSKRHQQLKENFQKLTYMNDLLEKILGYTIKMDNTSEYIILKSKTNQRQIKLVTGADGIHEIISPNLNATDIEYLNQSKNTLDLALRLYKLDR